MVVNYPESDTGVFMCCSKKSEVVFENFLVAF